MNMDKLSISIQDLEERLKVFEHYAMQNTVSRANAISETSVPVKHCDAASIEQRDSIVDDLLSQYRAQNNKSDTQQQASSNYFSCLNNVSYGAYMVEDDDKKMKDWIDEQKKCDDLIYHNDIKKNLKHLKKKNKKNVQITRPNGYIPFYNYSKQQPQRGRKKKKSKCKRRDRSNSVPPNEHKENEHFTFKPKINEYEFNRNLNPDVQRRLELWNKQKKMKLCQQIKEKKKEDEIKLQHATFKPEVKLTKKRPQSASNVSICAMSVQERLIELEQQRIEKLAKTKQIIEEEKMKQCSFKPVLKKSKLSKKISQSIEQNLPIWKRQDSVRNRQKKSRLASKKKIKKEIDSDLTFKPKINKTSKKIVQNAKLQTPFYPKDVSERLLLKCQKHKKNEQNKASECKPVINATSKKILEESILFCEASDNFFKRQKIYKLERKMKESELQNDKMEKITSKQTEFQPNIGNANNVLSKSKRHRHRYHFEDKEQRYERLAFHEKASTKRKIEMRAKELRKDETFKPEINSKSAKMGRPSSVYELFQPESSMKLKDRIQDEAEKIFKAQHPFQPEHKSDLMMVKKCRDAKAFCRSNSCMSYEDHQSAKKQKLLEARRQLDLEKMKECTFQPALKKSKRKKKKKKQNKYQNKIIVAGLDRFRELKELSSKKQQQIEKREHDVFSVNCNVLKSRRRTPSGTLQTVPKPFNLHTSNKCHSQRKMIQKENIDQKSTQRTEVSRQREMVWQILQEECDDDTTHSTLSLDSISTLDVCSDEMVSSVSDMSMEEM